MQTSTYSKLLISAAFGAVAGIAIVLIIERALLYTPASGIGAPGASQSVQARHVGTDSFADAVARAAPSVVNIFTAKVTTERQTLAFRDPLLQRYFGKLLPEQTRKRMETSLGSGVIVSADGYVLTNFHILKDADEIKVELPNGNNVPVKFVGNDPETDLAILKMDVSKASAIPIGNIRKLRVGDLALAIGNPFGVGQTVTMGIVSATGRNDLRSLLYEDFIQTDAAINAGNSGGALINAGGELIGINTRNLDSIQGAQNIGFAIPIGLALNVMNQIIDYGSVRRGWLGARFSDIRPTALADGSMIRRGIGVLEVTKDGPAWNAGIRQGDVVLELDGEALVDANHFMLAISQRAPGSQVELKVSRASETFETYATLLQQPPL